MDEKLEELICQSKIDQTIINTVAMGDKGGINTTFKLLLFEDEVHGLDRFLETQDSEKVRHMYIDVFAEFSNESLPLRHHTHCKLAVKGMALSCQIEPANVVTIRKTLI
mmetsp:Transcript_48360/g.94471  ORF Transcript_48360/g.94471 Transcript_48360/m.94471 type:complete len:109 (+) Transcript_48360:1327-1653(+)